MPSKKLHKVYRRLLRHNSLGNALYWPIESHKITPGSIGFFDDTGHWHLMSHAQFMPTIPSFSGILTCTDDPSPGDCHFSSDAIKGLEFNFGVQAEYISLSMFIDRSESFVGVPTEVEMKIHTLSTTKGAAVFKGYSMIRSAVERGGGELRKWAKENAEDIFDSELWTRDYGFFVVTATYRAKRCTLKCWQQSSQSNSGKVGIHVSGIPVGANAGIKNIQDARSAGWVVPPLHNENYRHGEIRSNSGSKDEESDEVNTPDSEEQEIQVSLAAKAEKNDDIGNSKQVEPDYGPEDGLEDKMARFTFQSDGRLFEVLCYDVVGDKVEL